MSLLPAWADAFEPERLADVRPVFPGLSRQWAFGAGRGAGVKVAVIDSGIDAGHPWVGGVAGGVVATPDETAPEGVRLEERAHEDLYGHGTACAAIIRSLAPECELWSVRVLGANLSGRGLVFAAGLRWAIEQGVQVVNLSLSSRSAALLPLFHELVDRATFADVMLVSAINNVPAPSYPSQFAGVFSVAAAPGLSGERWLANPAPPVEWGAPGIDVEVAWADGGSIVATGNSFAAPHLAGILTRIVGQHPGITVAEAKAILRALAVNAVDGG